MERATCQSHAPGMGSTTPKASKGANKVETEIINGTYENNNELLGMSVKALMELYYDHKKNQTDHASRLKDEVNLITI